MQNRILRRSAELLDETDDLTRRMDLQIFTQENGVDYTKEGWVPGEPIYVHPQKRPRRGTDGNGGRQYVRRMFDVWPILQPSSQFQVTDEVTGEVYDCESYHQGRCVDCDVDWAGNEPCWVCGKPGRDQRYSGSFSREYVFMADKTELDRFGFVARPITQVEDNLKLREFEDEQFAGRPSAANLNVGACGFSGCECQSQSYTEWARIAERAERVGRNVWRRDARDMTFAEFQAQERRQGPPRVRDVPNNVVTQLDEDLNTPDARRAWLYANVDRRGRDVNHVF